MSFAPSVMLASRCLRSSTPAVVKGPRLAAFMSTEQGGNSQGALHSLLNSVPKPKPAFDDSAPPTAPEGSHSLMGPPPPSIKNPLTLGLKNFARKINPEKPIYHLCWKSTKHNTVGTFTNEFGNPRAWVSGGACGFKHSRRGEYESGYQCAIRIFKKIEEELLMAEKPFELEILFKGFGQGRLALESVLMTSEGDKVRPLVCRVTDRTPIKIGGTRARKARRL